MKIENKIQKLKWYLKFSPPPFPHKNIKINGKEKKKH